MTGTGRCDTRRQWSSWALGVLDGEADGIQAPGVHHFPLPAAWGVDLYVLDESTNPSGSLKHRLAKALFSAAVVDGHIGPETTVVEASSGSTAVSEAYFSRLLDLPFIAVVPSGTSVDKIALIHEYGGRVELVADSAGLVARSREIAAQVGGYFMDQFSYASQVADWRGETGIGAAIFKSLAAERFPIPGWIVVGVGTGGTSSSIGRYARSRGYTTQLAMVDPEGSAYFDGWLSGESPSHCPGSRIEGIGRPGVENSFVPSVIDAAIRVSDGQSIAGMRVLEQLTGLRSGGSTGTNLSGALYLVAQMVQNGHSGSVVTLMCDAGDRYSNTYYSEDWLLENGWTYRGAERQMHAFLATGAWDERHDHMDFKSSPVADVSAR